LSVVKHFIEDSIKKKEIDEFLQNEFERAGYGGVSITKTPLGTHLVIYTMRPGLVIGRGGETIRALATVLEEQFQLPSPQISVAEIEVPELNAHVVASKIASALKRGIHYRRAGFWAIKQAMEAGALGIEIKISGKLRTDRARYEKFIEGYLPKSGEPPRRYMRKAEMHVHLKPGTLGVKVRLIPPEAVFPDQVKVHVVKEDLEPAPTRKIIEEPQAPQPEAKPEAEPEPAPEVAPKEEPEVIEVPATEPEPVPETAEKTEAVKEPAKPEASVVEEKPVAKETKEPEKSEPAPKPEPEPVAEPEVVVVEPTEAKEEKPAPKEEASEPEAPAKKAPAEEKKVKETAEPATEEKKEEAGE
jgi:small subunit ribosomal protein S3